MEQLTIAFDIQDTLLSGGLTQLISQTDHFAIVPDHDAADVILTDHAACAGLNCFRLSERALSARQFFPALLKFSHENISYDIAGDTFFPHLKKIICEDGQDIALTDLETELMTYLYRHKNHDCKKEQLLEQVWRYHKDVSTHTVETHIYRLRQKYPVLEDRLITKDSGYMLYLKDEDDGT